MLINISKDHSPLNNVNSDINSNYTVILKLPWFIIIIVYET